MHLRIKTLENENKKLTHIVDKIKKVFKFPTNQVEKNNSSNINAINLSVESRTSSSSAESSSSNTIIMSSDDLDDLSDMLQSGCS